jgi:hypothetical protein
MKKGLLVIVSFLMLNAVSAQFNNDFFNDSTKRISVSFGANYTYGSEAVNTSFLNKFLFGGKIEQNEKDDVYKNLNSINTIGQDVNYQLNVEIPVDTLFNKTNLSLLFGFEYVEHFDAQFTEDLFKFTFDGNKQFAGQKAEINNTIFNFFEYQQFNFGLISTQTKNNKVAKEGVIISLIKGQNHQAIVVPEGSIFTEQDGKELIVDINYTYNSSDTSNTNLLAFNGLGISTDLFTDFILKNGDKVHLAVNDLGFIYFNKSSLEYATDSTFYYDGIQVDNVFSLNDTVLSDISRDSLINNISDVKSGDYSIALPTAININYTKYFNQKWKLNVGFYHKILSNYFPLFYTNTYYYFNPTFALKAHVSYGGYGKMNGGLAIAKTIKNFDIILGTNNITAFFAPAATYTNSGFLGLKAYF